MDRDHICNIGFECSHVLIDCKSSRGSNSGQWWWGCKHCSSGCFGRLIMLTVPGQDNRRPPKFVSSPDRLMHMPLAMFSQRPTIMIKFVYMKQFEQSLWMLKEKLESIR